MRGKLPPAEPVPKDYNADRPKLGRRPLGLAGAVAGPFSLAVVAVHSWFEPGRFVAAGDVAPFIRTGFRSELFELWNHRVSGSGAGTSIVGHSFEIALLAATDRLGISAVTAQQIQFVLVAVFAMAGAMYFAGGFTERPVAVATSGIVAFFNPLCISLVPNPLPLVAIGTAGVLGGLMIRAAEDRQPSIIGGALALLPASYLSLNPPLLAVIAIWVLVMLVPARAVGGYGSIKRTVLFLVRLLPAAISFNLWWLVPTGLTLFGAGGGFEATAVTEISAWSWTHARASVANAMTLTATWTWGNPQYAPWAANLDAPLLSWTRYGLPAAAFAAPLLGSGRARRAAIAVLPVVLAAIFLIKGLHGPLGDFNHALYRHVPGFWLFREPVGKFGVPLVLLYALLSGLTVQALWSWLRVKVGWKWASGPMAVVLAVPLAATFPLLDGSVIPRARPPLPDTHVRVPAEWYRLARYINGDPAVDKVLVLPLGDYYQMPTKWGFYGTDAIPGEFLKAPVIQRNVGSYFGAPAAFGSLVTRVQGALLAQDLELAKKLLRDMSVTHVLLRNDFDPEFPGRTIADPSALRRSLDGLSSTSVDFGVGTVFHAGPPIRLTLMSRDAEIPLRWSGRGPGEYVIHLPPSRGTLVLRESYSRNWQLIGVDGVHSQFLGYANGWRVQTDKAKTIRLVYGPSRLSRLSGQLSIASAVGSIFVMILLRIRRLFAGAT